MAGYSNRDWECLRKRRYDRIEDAHNEAERMMATKHVGIFNVYRCRYCEKWHVGRIPGRRYA